MRNDGDPRQNELCLLYKYTIYIVYYIHIKIYTITHLASDHITFTLFVSKIFMVPTAAMLDLLFIQIAPIHLLLCIIYFHLNSLKNKEFISKAIGLNISIGLKDWNQNHFLQQVK